VTPGCGSTCGQCGAAPLQQLARPRTALQGSHNNGPHSGVVTDFKCMCGRAQRALCVQTQPQPAKQGCAGASALPRMSTYEQGQARHAATRSPSDMRRCRLAVGVAASRYNAKKTVCTQVLSQSVAPPWRLDHQLHDAPWQGLLRSQEKGCSSRASSALHIQAYRVQPSHQVRVLLRESSA